MLDERGREFAAHLVGANTARGHDGLAPWLAAHEGSDWFEAAAAVQRAIAADGPPSGGRHLALASELATKAEQLAADMRGALERHLIPDLAAMAREYLMPLPPLSSLPPQPQSQSQSQLLKSASSMLGGRGRPLGHVAAVAAAAVSSPAAAAAIGNNTPHVTQAD